MATSLKKITEFIFSKKLLRVLAIICALAAAAFSAIQPFYMIAYHNYYSILKTADPEPSDIGYIMYDYYSEEDEPASAQKVGTMKSNYCRDIVYADLCMLGTVYLKNCLNGKYAGTPQLYENLYSSFYSVDDKEDSPALKIEQTQYTIKNIDNDLYYFYVAYGDQKLTNIEEFKDKTPSEVYEESKKGFSKSEFNDNYYLRYRDNIYKKTLHDEDGLGKTEVYYTEADTNGGASLTSEYIDSGSLLHGGTVTTSLGDYILCYSPYGDVRISSIVDDYNENDDNDTCIIKFKSDSHGFKTRYELRSRYNYNFIREVTLDSDEFKKNASLNGIYCYELPEDEINVESYSLGCDIDPSFLEWYSLDEQEEGVSLEEVTYENVSTNYLTVFMSPKKDIAGELIASTEVFQTHVKYLGCALDIIAGIAAASAIAFLLLSLLCPVRLCRIEPKGRLERFKKPDLLLLIIILFWIAYEYSSSEIGNYLYSMNNWIGGRTAGTWAASVLLDIAILASVVISALSFSELVRCLKINGFKKRPRLMFDVICERTAPARKKINEKISNLPLVRFFRSLSLRTKYRLKLILAIIFSGLDILLLFVAFLAAYSHSLFYDVFIMALVCILSALTLITVISYLSFCSRLTKDMSLLSDKIDRVFTQEGFDGSAENEMKQSSPLYPMSEKLSRINERIDDAVQKQVQSEKMKVELVTNVSHDLKTPLTSIISYIDLLEKTDLNDEARDYVKILSRKSDKLRDIVADVFNLAKAVSGVEVLHEPIDLSVLLRQALADNDDKINSSNKTLRTNIGAERAPITGDGAKIYRVIQNLLDNALKYSLDGTRIYITLAEHNDGYRLSVKNISKDEMDFTAEEITERFTRGDASRTDGGSGLGLSIAKSFTEACGGSFSITLDGDVFLAEIFFKRREDTAEEITSEDIVPEETISEEIVPEEIIPNEDSVISKDSAEYYNDDDLYRPVIKSVTDDNSVNNADNNNGVDNANDNGDNNEVTNTDETGEEPTEQY